MSRGILQSKQGQLETTHFVSRLGVFQGCFQLLPDAAPGLGLGSDPERETEQALCAEVEAEGKDAPKRLI